MLTPIPDLSGTGNDQGTMIQKGTIVFEDDSIEHKVEPEPVEILKIPILSPVQEVDEEFTFEPETVLRAKIEYLPGSVSIRTGRNFVIGLAICLAAANLWFIS